MKNRNVILTLVSAATVSAALAGTATFTPIGATSVAPGTAVQWSVTVSAQTLAGIDAADIVIGTQQARDLTFSYSPAWQSAFAQVTSPAYDTGFYAQDVFVGGNNSTSVGRTLSLGTVTIDTTGLVEGSYEVRIDADLRPDRVSAVLLAGAREDVSGVGVFIIACPPADPQCDNDVDLNDFQLLAPCVSGPDVAASSQCQRYDMDGDADVDFGDMADFLAQFTGAL